MRNVPDDALVDFALVALREDGQWQLGALPHKAAIDLRSLVAAVRQQTGEGAAFALCSYGDDFFLAVRPDGDDVRVMVSDASAASEWPIAREALALVGEGASRGDADQASPAGDLEIFSDLGVGAMDVQALCADVELYPDEVLGQIAAQIGFGPQFDRAVGDDLT